MSGQSVCSNSNERLCEIFAMLISRLDTIEDKLDKLAEQDSKQLHERHKDAIRPLGEAFSAFGLTGKCVALKVFGHVNFDENGNFKFQSSDDNVFVLKDDFESTSLYNMPWEEGGDAWEWTNEW